MSAPCSGIHPLAVIGDPPEHRDHRASGLAFCQPDIHPTALVEALVTVDAGCFQRTIIGARTWLMKKVHVGHDCRVGDDVEIAPLTSIGGECVIGDRVKIGQGAVMKPRITIGDDAVIGAGAVATKDVPAGEIWVGNPARLLKLNPAVFGDGCEIAIEEVKERPLSLPVTGNGMSEVEQRQRAGLMPGGWLSDRDLGDEHS